MVCGAVRKLEEITWKKIHIVFLKIKIASIIRAIKDWSNSIVSFVIAPCTDWRIVREIQLILIRESGESRFARTVRSRIRQRIMIALWTSLKNYNIIIKGSTN